MALPSTIYKATINLSDIDRGVYESLAATVAQHPSETEERLVARLLAYAIFYEDDLTFTKGLCAADEPDIWVKGGDGRVRLWVEVGLPDAERIVKASRHSERAALLPCGRALPSWEMQQLPKLANIANLAIISVDQPFLAALVQRLERTVSWSVTITEGVCYVTSGDTTLETTLRGLGR
jgi:uncharacterized protein YaeQ